VRARPAIYYDGTNRARSPLPPTAAATYRAAIDIPLTSVELDTNVVSPEYFGVAGLPVVAGRTFPDEPQARRCRVAVVNEEAAAAYFGGHAVGGAVIDEVGGRTDIIGVVRSAQLGAFERRAAPAIYFPMSQDYLPRMTVILADRNAGPALAATVRRTLETVPGAGPEPIIVRTLDQYLDQASRAPLRIAMLAVRTSAALGLALALLGLYGTLGDAIRRQRNEMAVRIALGARRRDVVARVLGEGLRLVAPGAICGLAGCLLLSRALSAAVQSSVAPSVWVWTAGPLTLAAAVAVAGIVPARRSVMTDPAILLRDN
jgi:putative ABC transport system permease protein